MPALSFRAVPLRRRVWAAGTLLALAFYLARAVHLPRRTPLGVERRLFAVPGAAPRLYESPEDGRWIAVVEDQLAATPPPAWVQKLQEFTWPGIASPRKLTPFRPGGTWWVEGAALRRAWRYPAGGWLDARRLYAWVSDNPQVDPARPKVLDLRVGRTLPGEALVPAGLEYLGSAEEYVGGEDADLAEPLGDDALAEGLRRADVILRKVVEQRRVVEQRAVYFILWHEPWDGEDLLVASDEAAPRFLWLARRARLVALSRDGRTLFFEREGAVWRLDLRKPLPELLDEVPVPELPEPP